ncbi:ATP-binding protein [Streptomyces sp. NPDC002671]
MPAAAGRPGVLFCAARAAFGWRRRRSGQARDPAARGPRRRARLETADNGGRTRLEVSDPDAHARLVRRRPGADEESGRGLLPVDAVALRRGVEHCPGGKTVWCELSGETTGGLGGGLSGRSGACP